MPTPIDAIRPHTRNPRRIASDALAKLRESIQRDPEFMRLRPIVIDADGQILGGNQRWKACKALGYAELPDGWVVKADDLTDEQRRRFILVDNAPEGMAGGWDFDLLKTDWNLPELKDLGFDMTELGAEPEGDADAEPQVDRAAELNKKWGVKAGDLWLVGEHRLVCGDSTKADDVAKVMGGRKSTMIHTDPPYNVDYGASKNPRHKIRTIANDKQSPKEWEAFCRSLFERFQEVNDGDIYMWGASSPEGMKMRLWLVEAGCHWSATIVWKKQQLVLSPANYQRMYEPCFYGWFDKSSSSRIESRPRCGKSTGRTIPSCTRP